MGTSVRVGGCVSSKVRESPDFPIGITGRLEAAGVAVSRDGRRRALDNVFVERLWTSVKYEAIYINDYERVLDLEAGLSAYFQF